MDKMDDKRCVYTDPVTNERCKAYHQTDSIFCFMHDPEKAEARAVAVSQGGKSKAFVVNLAPVKIEKARDVCLFITRTLNEVRKGDLHPQVANSFFYGANILLKAFELSDFERKIEELEALVKSKGLL